MPVLPGQPQTITAKLHNSQYAILPDDGMLQGWTQEDEEDLDDLVRHKLHSRRARFKRSMKGFGQYVRRRKFPFSCFLSSTLSNTNLQLLDSLSQFMLP